MQSLIPIAFVGPDLETAWNAFAKPGIYYINRTLAIGRFLKAFGTFGALLVVADDKTPAIQTVVSGHEDVKIIGLSEFLLVETLFDQSVGGVSSFVEFYKRTKTYLRITLEIGLLFSTAGAAGAGRNRKSQPVAE